MISEKPGLREMKIIPKPKEKIELVSVKFVVKYFESYFDICLGTF